MTRNEARRTRCRHCPPSIGKVKPRTRTTKAQARVPCVPQLRAKGSLDSGSLRAGAAVRKAAAFLRLPSELTGKGTKEEHKRENKGKCRSFRSRFFSCFSPVFRNSRTHSYWERTLRVLLLSFSIVTRTGTAISFVSALLAYDMSSIFLFFYSCAMLTFLF